MLDLPRRVWQAVSGELVAPRILLERLVAEFAARYDRDPVILDWNTGLKIEDAFPDLAVFAPQLDGDSLPYLSRSIDIVVVRHADSGRRAEARRIASGAVVTITATTLDAPVVQGMEDRFSVRWVQNDAPSSLPSVSIVIPAYNASGHLHACLKALAQTLPDNFHGEILVVDDRSSDGTQRIAERAARRDARIRVLRNRRNMGFLDTANRGAHAASSEFLLFLNQDTIPLPGWLPPLLRTFRDFPAAGAVGGKLLYPDGRLQEAGGIIYRDGSAANVGRNDPNPDAPPFRFVRVVDYCSGALLMTPRALFLELGGFDERYRPGYYEDTDYCFSLRHRGHMVYYQPASQVIHVEGSAHGTDVTAGAKRYQVINSATFASKWAEVLPLQPERPEDFSRHSWLADALRGVTVGSHE